MTTGEAQGCFSIPQQVKEEKKKACIKCCFFIFIKIKPINLHFYLLYQIYQEKQFFFSGT